MGLLDAVGGAAGAVGGGVQILGGIAQYYQSQKAAGAAQSQLDAIKDSFNAIKPPDYDVSVMDPPNYIMTQVPEGAIDVSKITPQQYQTVAQFSPTAAAYIQEKNPQVVQKSAAATTGRQAQLDALQKMRTISQTGQDPVAQQLEQNAERQGQISAQSRQASVLQDAARRGQMGSGTMLAAQLQGGSDAMQRAAEASQGAASNAYQNKLAMTGQAAQLGGQIAGQENQEAAQNANIINAFNQRTATAGQNYANQNANMTNQAQLLNQQNAQNVANQNVAQNNQAQMYNQQYGNQMAQQQYQNQVNAQNTQNQLIGNQAQWQAAQRDYLNQLKSAQYSNQMGKANALAGVGNEQINMDYSNAANTNKAIQGVTGAVSTMAAAPTPTAKKNADGTTTAGEDETDYSGDGIMDENEDTDGIDPKVKAYLRQAALNQNAPAISDIANQQADVAARNTMIQGLGKAASMMGAVGPKGTEAGNDVLDTTMPGFTKASGMAANAKIGGLMAQDEARQKLYNSLAGAQQKQNQMNQQKDEFGQKIGMEKENAAATRGLTASNQQFMHGQKEDQDFEKFGHELNANLLARGPTADQQKKMNAAASLNTLISSQPDYNKLTPQQVHELAIAASNLVAGGSGAAQQTISSITPHGISQDAASLEQYFNNAPQGANMGAFVKNLKDIADRESATSRDIVGQAVTQAASGFSHLKAKNPDRFNMMVKNNLGQYGVSSEDFDENGAYQGKKFAPQPQNNPSNTAGNNKQQPDTLLDAAGGKANAGNKAMPTSADQEAIRWVIENPSHPKAKAVRDSLVKRGLLMAPDSGTPTISFQGQ